MKKSEIIIFISSLLYLTYHTNIVSAQNILKDGNTVKLSLSNITNSVENKRVLISNNASITIIVESIPNEVNFVILQVHTFKYQVLLKYSPNVIENDNIIGTNIGLVKFINSSSSVNFYLTNLYDGLVSSMIAVIGYNKESPVPGGCSMEFATSIAPYLDISYSNETVIVKAEPSSLSNSRVCNPNSDITYTFYNLFISSGDYSEETYFNSLLKMISYTSVMKNSEEAKATILGLPLERIFSRYYGVGRVFTVIAMSSEGEISAYVPAISYSCNITDEDTCDIQIPGFTRFALILLAILSVFMLNGHSYSNANSFIITSVVGSFLIFIITENSQFEMVNLVIITLGVLFSIIWISIFYFCSKPTLNMLMCYLAFGFIATTFIFCFIKDKATLFEIDWNYWAIFLSLNIVLLFIPLFFEPYLNKVILNFINMYFIVMVISLYIGLNSSYILINVIRRATVKAFYLANTSIKFEPMDIVLWVTICAFTMYRCQTCKNGYTSL